MTKWMFIFLFSFQLFGNQYEEQIATEKNYQKFSQYHHMLNQFFENKVNLTNAIEMNVFSYNAGMLSLAVVAVPKYEERAPFLIERLEQVNFEIASFQEIWNDSEREALEKFAEDNNYYVYSGSQKYKKKHGLFILVRRDFAKSDIKFSEYIYDKQAWYEPVTGYYKGALKAEFTLHNGKKMLYLNTHLTAVANGIRDKQAQELIKKIKTQADYFFLTGDLNNNPFMEEQVYWPLVRHFRFLDVHLAQHPNADGFTYDPTRNAIARHWGMAQNSRERIDYILLGRTNENVGYFVQNSKLMFTQDLPSEDCMIKGANCKLSDHFGVGAQVYLF